MKDLNDVHMELLTLVADRASQTSDSFVRVTHAELEAIDDTNPMGEVVQEMVAGNLLYVPSQRSLGDAEGYEFAMTVLGNEVLATVPEVIPPTILKTPAKEKVSSEETPKKTEDKKVEEKKTDEKTEDKKVEEKKTEDKKK